MIRPSRCLLANLVTQLSSVVITYSYAAFPTTRLFGIRTGSLRVQALSNRNHFMPSKRPFEPDMDSNGDDPVTIQKGRVLALWSTICRAIQVPEDVVNTITKRLELGFVPPVFHAYSALFKTNGGAKKLQRDGMESVTKNKMIVGDLERLPSMNCVTSGIATVSQMGVVFEKGYMDAFFEDGEARDEVRDYGGHVWTFSGPWTKIVCQLINTEAEMIGADVEVTKVDSDFNIGNVVSASAAHLITRRLSCGVVSESLNMPTRDTRAIVGCTGIGKSWTLLYALQQLLLYNGACVLFYADKAKIALACMRRDDKVYVWHLGTLSAFSALFSFENVWVLLDPQEATAGGTEIVTGKRRLLFAAYNDERHFASDMLKTNPKALYYLDPYTEDELRVALPVMSANKVFDERVLDWASQVGMLPRCLLNEGQFKARLRLFTNAILALTRDDVKELAASRGFSNSRTSRPDTVFVIRAARDVDEDKEEEIAIGYDGESGIIYTKRSISVMTKYVWDEVTKGDRESMITLWGVVDFWPWKERKA
jgi:hypothetical protein